MNVYCPPDVTRKRLNLTETGDREYDTQLPLARLIALTLHPIREPLI